MNIDILLFPILLPLIFAVMGLFLKSKKLINYWAVLGSAAVLYCAYVLFGIKQASLVLPWLGHGIDFDLKLYGFNAAILLWVNIFTFLVVLYSTIKMETSTRIKEYYLYVFLTVMFANGSVLADNFVLFLFFWGGLLITLYMLIMLGNLNSYKTALKSLILLGLCDFCLLLGVVLLWKISGSLKISAISLEAQGLAMISFLLIMIGAIGKAGAMPFHNWIPDAAIDAPVTVMAFLPASLEKLLGIYLLTRISLDVFHFQMNSPVSIVLMTVGAITIVFAVMMALIQKDFKRLLSYHAVSQVGYMILGIGTGTPLGIVGGIFHMLNHAIYKTGLFLSSGSVELAAGTTEMKKLGGLMKSMPVTGLCFSVCALSISGVWPFNGFVSKEMIFHGSYETGYLIFTIAAWVGAIFTFASFLKAGHSIFFGAKSTEIPEVKENSWPVLVPMIILSAFCILFGVYSILPLKLFILPALSGHPEVLAELTFTHNLSLLNPIALISMGCLVIAFGLHYLGVKKGQGKAYLASEPVHNLPIIKTIYNLAENRVFDFYEQGVKLIKLLSKVIYYTVDRPIDFVYERVVTVTGRIVIFILRVLHNGRFANYLSWSLAGLMALGYVMGTLIKKAG
ncbi:MAG: hypothetical protein A2252_11240 [Elusimicrobia bacterium RIFOXYA2_FULL_39_19]|nr:MAG: hypothetical protein A2252_11240 [Elusimicrobia bacterium RIFOXYA2_FULL_39_19]